ncbi:hypothetical protein IE077_001143, partial [Cardiosporidium cionae]
QLTLMTDQLTEEGGHSTTWILLLETLYHAVEKKRKRLSPEYEKIPFRQLFGTAFDAILATTGPSCSSSTHCHSLADLAHSLAHHLHQLLCACTPASGDSCPVGDISPSPSSSPLLPSSSAPPPYPPLPPSSSPLPPSSSPHPPSSSPHPPSSSPHPPPPLPPHTVSSLPTECVTSLISWKYTVTNAEKISSLMVGLLMFPDFSEIPLQHTPKLAFAVLSALLRGDSCTYTPLTPIGGAAISPAVSSSPYREILLLVILASRLLREPLLGDATREFFESLFPLYIQERQASSISSESASLYVQGKPSSVWQILSPILQYYTLASARISLEQNVSQWFLRHLLFVSLRLLERFPSQKPSSLVFFHILQTCDEISLKSLATECLFTLYPQSGISSSCWMNSFYTTWKIENSFQTSSSQISITLGGNPSFLFLNLPTSPLSDAFLSFYWPHLCQKAFSSHFSKNLENYASSSPAVTISSPSSPSGGSSLPSPRLTSPPSSPSFISLGVSEGLLEHLLIAVLHIPKPILLFGPAGGGKTFLLSELLHRVGHSLPILSLYLDEQTDIKTLLGTWMCGDHVGAFEWQEGILIQAMKRGQWIVLEDLQSVSHEILIKMKEITENRSILIGERNELVIAHPHFRLFATFTTQGDALYALGHEVISPPSPLLPSSPPLLPSQSTAVFTSSRQPLQEIPEGCLRLVKGWTPLCVPHLQKNDVHTLLERSFPLVAPFVEPLLHSLCQTYIHHRYLFQQSKRIPTLRDLLIFCRLLVDWPTPLFSTVSSLLTESNRMTLVKIAWMVFFAHLPQNIGRLECLQTYGSCWNLSAAQ